MAAKVEEQKGFVLSKLYARNRACLPGRATTHSSVSSVHQLAAMNIFVPLMRARNAPFRLRRRSKVASTLQALQPTRPVPDQSTIHSDASRDRAMVRPWW